MLKYYWNQQDLRKSWGGLESSEHFSETWRGLSRSLTHGRSDCGMRVLD